MRYFVKEIFPLLLTIAGIVAILTLWNPNGNRTQNSDQGISTGQEDRQARPQRGASRRLTPSSTGGF